jgi:Mg2+ and Co2+ transporter CorA
VLHFQSRLMEEGFPRLDYLENSALIFVLSGESFPPSEGNKYFTIKRTGIMVVCANNKIITISREPTDLFETVLEGARKRAKGNPSIIIVLYEIFNYIIQKYRTITSDIELVLLHMERIVKPTDSTAFLERTFNFKKEVTQVASNLHHLNEVIRLISSKRVPLQGFDKSWDDAFNVLADEASFLNESADNGKDSILSIIDLHLNRTSYETNKVMRVLAVITALAIIPAVITGMLGENLLDLMGGQYFHAYLWQVIIVVALGMVIVLYVFSKLGWLKS